ncbi:MAG: nucleotidyltransferase family protein [Gemmatimonadota bacterium]|nr:nucleotidyltransferase family protein [Gemmatimonadota bacterium]
MIAGIVPCAGASVRMGQPKALLRFDDRTFVQAVVDALNTGGCDPVLTVVPDDEAIAHAARATGARVLTNPHPGEGPITSMRLALAALEESLEGLIYHAVDYPCVRSETVSALIEVARESDAALVIPTYEGVRGHPSFFRESLFSELLDPTLEGGARMVVHRHLEDARLVAVDDPGVRMDIDTPADYRAMSGAQVRTP